MQITGHTKIKGGSARSHLFFVILPLHSKRGTYVHYLVYNLNMRKGTLYKRGD